MSEETKNELEAAEVASQEELEQIVSLKKGTPLKERSSKSKITRLM